MSKQIEQFPHMVLVTHTHDGKPTDPPAAMGLRTGGHTTMDLEVAKAEKARFEKNYPTHKFAVCTCVPRA